MSATRAPVFYQRGKYPERRCAHCGQAFYATTSTQRFCSLSCSTQATANARQQAGLSPHRQTKPCEHCGRQFVPFRAGRKYCDSACAGRAISNRRAAARVGGVT